MYKRQINCFQARYFEREEFKDLVGPNPHYADDEDPNYVASAVGSAAAAVDEQSPDSAPASVAANARDDVSFVVDEEDLIPMIRMTVAAWIEAVSYTHLDVYKRQVASSGFSTNSVTSYTSNGARSLRAWPQAM